MAKLDTNQLHLLQLAARDSDAEGWMPVSKMLWPVIQFLPDDLVEKRARTHSPDCRWRRCAAVRLLNPMLTDFATPTIEFLHEGIANG